MAEVLIVDDDRNLRETLRELLDGAGYKVHTATTVKRLSRSCRQPRQT